MAFKVTVLLSMFAVAYLLVPLALTSGSNVSPHHSAKAYSISLVVYNSLTSQKNLTFTTAVAYRGILLGAMRKIQAATNKFRFKVTEDPNYGPFLVSVNGVAGNNADHTYWELLAKLQNGTIIRPDVGVGCYIPNANDTVILKFTKW